MSDKDVIDGKLKQAEGKAQDAYGDVSGDVGQDIKGKAKQAEGKIQEGYGRLTNAVKDAVEEDDL